MTEVDILMISGLLGYDTRQSLTTDQLHLSLMRLIYHRS